MAWKTKFDASTPDFDGRLETYYRVNPTLEAPKYLSDTILESDRIIISRFRCGSHSLRIEIDRFTRPYIPREQRHCKCNQGIQTILHCFCECPLVNYLLPTANTHLETIFNDPDISTKLMNICWILKIPF